MAPPDDVARDAAALSFATDDEVATPADRTLLRCDRLEPIAAGGYCRTCGADTSPRNGKGDAYRYCRRCRPGAAERKWTRERAREAMRR